MKSLFVLISLSFLSINILAQRSSITGRVLASDSSTSLAGISIYLDGSQVGTASNAKGEFKLENLSSGEYTLVASGIGYTKFRQQVLLKEGEQKSINIILIESVAKLPEMAIISQGNVGIRDIPGSVHYISPKELEKFSYTDINRSLRSVPGVNIQEEDGFGLRPNIGLRGTGVERSSKITVMEDGVLMAPAPYAAPAAYYFPTIGRMQGIEILKGSSQIKYGPHTTGGALNLISTMIPESFSGRVQLMGGSFGARNLHAHVGNAHKNFAYMVETFQYGADGFKQLDGGGNTGFTKEDYLAKLRVNSDADAKMYQSLTLKLGYSRETSNETYLGLTSSDFAANPIRRYAASQEDQMNTEQTQVSLSHQIDFNEQISLKTTAYRNDFSRNWYKLDKVQDTAGNKYGIAALLEDPQSNSEALDIIRGKSSMNDNALLLKANNREYYAQGVQTAIGLNFNTNKLEHKIDLGIRVHQDQIDRFQWIDAYAMDNGVMELTESGEPGTESNRIETANAIASYVQYKLIMGDLSLTPGLRYENIRMDRLDYGKNDPERSGSSISTRGNNSDVFIPGLAVDYKFSRYLSSFAGVHQGFSPPGSTEGTEAERSINYELGARYTKNSLSGQLVLFYNDYDNLLGSDLAAAGGAGTTDLFNGGRALTRGVEMEFGFDLLSLSTIDQFRLPLTLVYTYTDGSFQNNFDSDFDAWGSVSSGDELPYLANHQFSFGLSLEHRKFDLNLSGRYMDQMRTAPGQGAMIASESTDAYFVIDASANYQLHKNFGLFLNMTNISDEVYVVSRRPAGLRPGMPRAFNAGVKARF